MSAPAIAARTSSVLGVNVTAWSMPSSAANATWASRLGPSPMVTSWIGRTAVDRGPHAAQQVGVVLGVAVAGDGDHVAPTSPGPVLDWVQFAACPAAAIRAGSMPCGITTASLATRAGSDAATAADTAMVAASSPAVARQAVRVARRSECQACATW